MFVTSALCFIFTVPSAQGHVITRLDYLYSEAKEGEGAALCSSFLLFRWRLCVATRLDAKRLSARR